MQIWADAFVATEPICNALLSFVTNSRGFHVTQSGEVDGVDGGHGPSVGTAGAGAGSGAGAGAGAGAGSAGADDGTGTSTSASADGASGADGSVGPQSSGSGGAPLATDLGTARTTEEHVALGGTAHVRHVRGASEGSSQSGVADELVVEWKHNLTEHTPTGPTAWKGHTTPASPWKLKTPFGIGVDAKPDIVYVRVVLVEGRSLA